jgi:selenocysteine-specific elongation factor
MKKVIVVLNKVDMVEDKKVLESKIAALRKVFAKTKFGENLVIVPFSTKTEEKYHNNHLKEILLDQITIPDRQVDNKFLYLIDHCFKIKGKGTVITGTVVEGRVKPGEEI